MVYNNILKRYIPKGWEVKDIKELCNIKYGENLSNNDLIKDALYNVYGANGIIGKYNKYMYNEPKIIIGCRGSVGNVSYTYDKCFITHNSLILDNLQISFEYLYLFCKNNNFNYLASGSVQKQLTIENCIKYKVLIPPKIILTNFSNLIKSKIDLIINNKKQNHKLSQLRDFLLPMLMNGQVEVMNN